MRPLRSIRSACRLLSGACRTTFLRADSESTAEVISVDIFGTLVARTSDDDAAWRAGAIECVVVAAQHGLRSTVDPIGLRGDVERLLTDVRVAAGLEPEFTHEQVFIEMLKRLGAGEWAAEASRQLADWQLQREIEWTYRVPAVADWVEKVARSGKRVVAVSDTRYTGAQLATLLSRHGVSGVAAVYASVDYGASKFSGRLFDRVAELEHVKPSEILHVGDDLLRDGFAAAQRGLRVRRIRRPARSAQVLPAAPPAASPDPAYALGYETIGPVLVAFVRILLDRACRDGIRRLAFVARDGELPFRVAQLLMDYHPSVNKPEVRYVYLSRRSTASAISDFWKLDQDPAAIDRLISTVRGIRLLGTFAEGFQTFFQLPKEWIEGRLRGLGCERGGEEDVRRLLSDSIAVRELQQLLAPMRARLNRYLEQEQLLLAETALVDVGWQGTILEIVRQQAEAASQPGPRGYFLGLWSDKPVRFNSHAAGLLCDQRRSRSVQEGAAFHVSMVLEAACRENRGITIGYRDRADGTVEPEFLQQGRGGDAERQADSVHDRIAEGVLAYARWFGESRQPPVDERKLRAAAQHRLFELAFFPTVQQRNVGRSLLYSESTSDGRVLSLISERGQGLRGWIAGLRSPWKGAYLCENGGRLPASLYCVAEGIMSWIPGGKPALRRILVRDG